MMPLRVIVIWPLSQNIKNRSYTCWLGAFFKLLHSWTLLIFLIFQNTSVIFRWRESLRKSEHTDPKHCDFWGLLEFALAIRSISNLCSVEGSWTDCPSYVRDKRYIIQLPQMIERWNKIIPTDTIPTVIKDF